MKLFYKSLFLVIRAGKLLDILKDSLTMQECSFFPQFFSVVFCFGLIYDHIHNTDLIYTVIIMYVASHVLYVWD